MESFVEAPQNRWQEIGEAIGGSELPEKLRQTLMLTQLRQKMGLTYGQIRKPGPTETYAEVLRLYGKILSRAMATVRGWGGEFYFVYLPEWEPFGNPENVDGRREVVLAMVQRLGLPTIDIHEAFRGHEDPLSLFPFRVDGHYNEAGHRLVAQTVLRSIDVN